MSMVSDGRMSDRPKFPLGSKFPWNATTAAAETEDTRQPQPQRA